MRFTNPTGLPAGWTMGFQRDGREMLVVIVKATYAMPANDEQPMLAEAQQPLIEADRFSGEPGLSAPTYETDYAHRKPACDVLLVGSAHAQPGRRVARTRVGIQVGALTKQFDVVGARTWRKHVGIAVPSEPEPFECMPISYDNAFGGTDRTDEEEGRSDAFAANPVGLGYGRHGEWIDGRPLPNTEQIGQAITDPGGDYTPMALSPIGRNWLPRRSYAGTYDQQWIENTAPLWPDDFDERYFQAAPPDQTLPFPQGDEAVVLLNLTSEGRRSFRLPGRRMPVTFIPHQGRDAVREAVLDTIVLEPDVARFTLAWRCALPLGRSVFDVKETVVGEMSSAWHRARRFPGKTYYTGLNEAVRARRSA